MTVTFTRGMLLGGCGSGCSGAGQVTVPELPGGCVFPGEVVQREASLLPRF